jgi:MoaA/NifB/PqqE/SkfB family radical SAM enzyme
MPDDVLDAILKTSSAINIGEVYMCGWGEPFLSPRIFDTIEYFRKRHIPTIVQTNGTLIGNLADKILHSGPDLIDVSMHGGDETTYQRVMVGANLQDTLAGLKELQQSKSSTLSAPKIRRFIFCLSHETIESLPEVILIATSLDVKTIFLQFLQEPPFIEKPQKITRCDLEKHGRYHELFVKCNKLALNSGVSLRIDDLLFLPDPPVDSQEKCRGTTLLCTSPWTNLDLFHDGRYRVCHYPEVSNFIDLPPHFSLFKLWNQPLLKKIRRGLISGDLVSWCRECQHRAVTLKFDLIKKVAVNR